VRAKRCSVSDVHIVILGCGRVGSLLAEELDHAGHSVAVIDQESKAFRRLGDNFGGSTVTGMGFDRQTLESAGIERAHAFAAVSSGDNTNIIAARVARETYDVERVVARIYDLRRAEVYERLGIPTVATVSWTAGQMMRRLLPSGAAEEYRDPSGHMVLAELAPGDGWFGLPTTSLEAATGSRIGFVTRYGVPLLPTPDTILQEGDILHVIFPDAERSRIDHALLAGPSAHEES
jgi:trk system potassium uptake protein